MKSLVFKILLPKLVIFASVVFFGVTVFGVNQVHQSGIMEAHKTTSFCHTEDCGSPLGDPLCVSNCLNDFENSLQTLPAYLLYFALTIFVFSILIKVTLNFVFTQSFDNLRSFVRKRRERFILSYFSQLGSWLTLFSKRDPAIIFASI